MKFGYLLLLCLICLSFPIILSEKDEEEENDRNTKFELELCERIFGQNVSSLNIEDFNGIFPQQIINEIKTNPNWEQYLKEACEKANFGKEKKRPRSKKEKNSTQEIKEESEKQTPSLPKKGVNLTKTQTQTEERIQNLKIEMTPSPYNESSNMTLEFPEELFTRIKQRLEYPPPSSIFYPNITGVYKGKWNSNLLEFNTTLLTKQNIITEEEGTFSLHIETENTSHDKIKFAKCSLRFFNGDGHSRQIKHANVHLVGLHFQQLGILLLQSENSKEELFEYLPIILRNELSSATVVLEEKYKEFEEKKLKVTENDRGTFPKREFLSGCSFSLFLKLHPVPSQYSLKEVLQYENELIRPRGNPTIKLGDIELEGLICSKTCGFAYDSNSKGIRLEVYFTKSIYYAFFLSLATIIEIGLFIRQMKHGVSDASLVKVSTLTIGHFAIFDSYICLVHLTTGISSDPTANAFSLVSFLKFVLFTILEMRYLLLVWKAQRMRIMNYTWNQIRTEITRLYLFFYGCLLFGIVLFYNSSGFLLHSFIVLMFCFWIPQIVHSIRYNYRKPLDRTFVIGTSIARLYLPLYFYVCPRNIIAAETNVQFCLILILVLFVQVVILMVQHTFGPRFFLPKQFSPEIYDYHRPILTEVISVSASDPHLNDPSRNEDASTTTQLFHCAICKDDIDLSRKDYMITPCNHIFHQPCLLQSMRFKMECPICRADLPEPI